LYNFRYNSRTPDVGVQFITPEVGVKFRTPDVGVQLSFIFK